MDPWASAYKNVNQYEKTSATRFIICRRADVTKAVMNSVKMNSGAFFKILSDASKNKRAQDIAFRLIGQDYPAFAQNYKNRKLIYPVCVLEKPKISPF